MSIIIFYTSYLSLSCKIFFSLKTVTSINMKLIIQFIQLVVILGICKAITFDNLLKYDPDYVYSFWKYYQGARVNASYLEIPNRLMIFLDYELNNDNSRIKLFWTTNKTSKETFSSMDIRYSNNYFWTFDIAGKFLIIHFIHPFKILNSILSFFFK
jgi:hypothetical protein